MSAEQSSDSSLTDILAASVVIGTIAGFCDGLATLSRNVYVPHFALLCVSAPIVLTTAWLAIVAIPLAILARLRGWAPYAALARAITILAGIVCALALLFWWTRLAGQAAQAGGGGALSYLILLGLAALTVGVTVVVRAALLHSDPLRLRRWVRRGAVGCGVLNVLAIAFLGVTMAREGRDFLIDRHSGPPRRPDELNVLLITIDTLRADRLATFGGAPGLTPHLDQLAAEGVAFATAIAQSPWTLPSIASIFTGLTPGGHGAGWSTNGLDLLARTPLGSEVWTFVKALKACGYLTQAFVTNPYLSMRYGFGAGFDRFENVTMESEAFVALGDTLAVRLLASLFPNLVTGDTGVAVTARVLPWLDRHHEEKFLVWLHYLDAHAPYGDPHVLGNKSFRGDTLLSAITPGGGTLGTLPFIPIARLRAGEVHLDPAQRRQLISLYDAGVRYDDEQVGHVLRRLGRLGLSDHTLVVVASDHGEEFWEHGGVEHGHTLYEELIRVPLIVRWPGGPARTRISDVVRLMDIAPTITDLTGCQAAPEDAIEGRSLRPLLVGRDEPRTAMSHGLLFAEERRALRSERFKYIEWAHGKEEVYDLRSDPNERRDLAGQEELIAALRTQLRERVVAQLVPLGPSAARVDDRTRELMRVLGYGR